MTLYWITLIFFGVFTLIGFFFGRSWGIYLCQPTIKSYDAQLNAACAKTNQVIADNKKLKSFVRFNEYADEIAAEFPQYFD